MADIDIIVELSPEKLEKVFDELREIEKNIHLDKLGKKLYFCSSEDLILIKF